MLLVLSACAEDNGAQDASNDDRPTIDAAAGTSDDNDDFAVPPLYLVETAEDEAGDSVASMLTYGQEPVSQMDALMEGDLALSGECLGVASHHDGSFVPVVWPYGYSVGLEDGEAVLLDENGDVIAREGEPISMGGGNVPDNDGDIGEVAPVDCQAGGYWLAGSEVRRLAPEVEPDPAIDNGLTVYFPQWEDVPDDSRSGSFGGRLTFENGCLYLDHEQAGQKRLGIWPPGWGVEVDGDDVVVLDQAGDEAARTGDIVAVTSHNGPFDVDEYGIPGDCHSMHTMVFDLEVTGGPDDEMPDPHVQTAEPDILEEDARQYAEEFDLDLDEAIWRLEMQSRLMDEPTILEQGKADRFGGLFWEHEPEFRLVVLMTDGDEEAVKGIIGDPELLEVLDVRTVDVTYQELNRTHREVVQLLGELGVQASSGVRIQENRVEIYVADSSVLEGALDAASEELPEHVVVVEEDATPEPLESSDD